MITAAAAAGVVLTTTGVFSSTGSDTRSVRDGAEFAYQAPGPMTTRTVDSPSPSPTPTATPSKTTAHTAKPRTHKPARHRPRHSSTHSSASVVVGSGSCEASFYGEGQMTASGEAFDPGAMTAAHKSLPFGTRLRVTNKNNGESAIVRINDRGPYVSGRCLDLSTAAMRAVGGIGSGVIPVRYQILARS
ncbi:MAG TPA: septal ring lytic transglycosylase RlpA family protein [Streptosporangiaceae bacterium]